eukprot:1181047-Prorocentrum_minimum.AAC.1
MSVSSPNADAFVYVTPPFCTTRVAPVASGLNALCGALPQNITRGGGGQRGGGGLAAEASGSQLDEVDVNQLKMSQRVLAGSEPAGSSRASDAGGSSTGDGAERWDPTPLAPLWRPSGLTLIPHWHPSGAPLASL